MLKQMLTVGAKDAVLLKVEYSKMIIHFASATSTIVRIQIRIDVPTFGYMNNICSESFDILFSPTYSVPGPRNWFEQHSQSDLPPLRPLCDEAPDRDSNPGRADLLTGTLLTRPPHLTTQILFANA